MAQQYSIVASSFDYLADPKNDLETILLYMASVWCHGSLFELFRMTHENVQDCCRFDSQKID